MAELIFPGKEIAVSEEAQASGGTADDNGVIYATVVGSAKLEGGIASVSNSKSPRLLKSGDLVLGKVEDLFDQVALVSFQPLEKNIASSVDRAFLRISEIRGRAGGFVDNFKEFLRIGDLIRARVIEVTDLGVYLTIAENGLGVLKAFCTTCRMELNENLECKTCMHRERRKMA
ncbi:MAG: exosome complex RNA-binding protein Csl4 [Candidatus Norongarragalinales archaeon]